MQIPHCPQHGEEDGERSYQNPEIKTEALRSAVTFPPAEQGVGVPPKVVGLGQHLLPILDWKGWLSLSSVEGVRRNSI